MPKYINDLKTPNGWPIYTFVRHSISGSGGYLTGDYLVPFTKESKIANRKKINSYKNYVREILNSVITPVFNRTAKRITDNVIFEEFLKDVDRKGTSIQDFTRSVVEDVKAYGTSFIVMDNTDDEYNSQSAVIENRSFPYIYKYSPEHVYSYTTDDDGELTEITFYDYEDKDSVYYLSWCETYLTRYTSSKSAKDLKLLDRTEHNLGFLPVVTITKQFDQPILTVPTMYDLCRQNWDIYNQSNETRHTQRLTSFPILTLQSRNKQNANLNVGSDSVLVYGEGTDGSVTAPAWINPDVAIQTSASQLISDSISKLTESANVFGSTAVKDSSSSGLALSYKFQGQLYALQDTKTLAEKIEYAIKDMFELFVDLDIEYYVEYQENYSPSQDEFDKKILLLERMLELNMGPEVDTLFKKTIFEDVVSFYKLDISKEDIQTYKEYIGSNISEL